MRTKAGLSFPTATRAGKLFSPNVRFVVVFRAQGANLHPSATADQPNQTEPNMKTLITITAIAPTTSAPSVERQFSFIRPHSATKPTYRGAERMVAKEVGCKPSQVSAIRVEACCYDTK